MKARVYWKLAASQMLVAVLTLGVLGAYLSSAVRAAARQEMRESVRLRALLAREVLRERVSAGPQGAGLKELAARLARNASARVTLIGPDGAVLADSEHDPATMDNHASRPEVRAAVREGIGVATRRSDTLGIDYLYVAAPLEPGERSGIVVRLAVPLAEVAAAGGPVRRAVTLGLLLALALIAALSLWLARGIVRPLDELGQAAEALAAGDLSRRARVDTGDEVQRLADTFNSMADRLAVTLTELRSAHADSDTILANMADGVIVTDAAGVVTLLNRASEEMLGALRHDAIGRSVEQAALHFELGEMVAQCLVTGAAERREARVERPTPRVLDAAATAILGDDGKPAGCVVVLHDLTEVRRLENVRREFVANVSHELRTPVAAVRSLVETLSHAAADDPEAAGTFLTELERQTERLSALLDDLLELARLDSGKREMARESVDLAALIQSAVSRLAPAADAKRQTVDANVQEGLACWADAQALERVVVNLLDNAIKYTGDGGSIRVSAAQADDAVVIEVADDGPGIPEADQPRIFERFYRVDRARSRELGGTGLGLSIVKHIVESHGGEVGVESAVGRGSTFRVRLPAPSGPQAG
jgi:two-component system phosphate regulon sensor histidine kinase PhoR